MTVAAAIRITSSDEERVIRHAAAFAQQQRQPCFIISVVRALPYGEITDEERDVVIRNLELIAQSEASPIMQEGDNVAKTLLQTAQGFGVQTLFLQTGAIAEQLLHFNPPFDVVVVSSE